MARGSAILHRNNIYEEMNRIKDLILKLCFGIHWDFTKSGFVSHTTYSKCHHWFVTVTGKMLVMQPQNFCPNTLKHSIRWWGVRWGWWSFLCTRLCFHSSCQQIYNSYIFDISPRCRFPLCGYILGERTAQTWFRAKFSQPQPMPTCHSAATVLPSTGTLPAGAAQPWHQ